jgi:hypothetical protein
MFHLPSLGQRLSFRHKPKRCSIHTIPLPSRCRPVIEHCTTTTHKNQPSTHQHIILEPMQPRTWSQTRQYQFNTDTHFSIYIILTVPQVSPAPGVQHFHPRHKGNGGILHLDHVVRVDRRVKGGPSGARVKLGVATEQREVAHGRDICAFAFVVVWGAVDGGTREGTFRARAHGDRPASTAVEGMCASCIVRLTLQVFHDMDRPLEICQLGGGLVAFL